MAPVFLFCFVFSISPFKCLANICITVLTGKSLKTTSAHANKPRIHFTGKKNNNNKKRPKNKNPKQPACARPPSPQSPSTRLPPRSPVPVGAPDRPLALSRQSAAVFANTDIAVRVQPTTNPRCGGTLRAALRAAPPRHCRTPGSRAPAEAARSGGSARLMRSLSQLRYVGGISFFQYLFLIPLLLGTLKNPSSTGFPLCFKGTWGFYGVLPRLPEAHTHSRPAAVQCRAGKIPCIRLTTFQNSHDKKLLL